MLPTCFPFVFFIFFFPLYVFCYDYQLGLVTMFKNEGPYLREWIEYHKMMGVEHFWLFNNKSSDDWQDVLQPYIDKKLVEVIDWPYLPGSRPDGTASWWVPTQVAAFREGLKRSVGKAKWVAVIDMDEFLVPMQDDTVIQCLDNHFLQANGVYVSWLNFGTNHIVIPKGAPILFKLTACSERNHSENITGKSIVRPDYIFSVNYPHWFPLKQGAYFNGDGKEMFFSDYLPADNQHHDQLLRINHYVFRDEAFFLNNRLPSAGADRGRRLNQYFAFGKKKDFTICKLIQKKHSEKYQEIWSKNNPSQKHL